MRSRVSAARARSLFQSAHAVDIGRCVTLFTRISRWLLLVAAALTLCTTAAWAQSTEPADGTLRFSGFGTVSLAHIDEPPLWAYRRDISQSIDRSRNRADLDSRLGLQINYAPSAQFELVTQAVIAPRSDASNTADNISWAFAAYRPNTNWTLRVGRVNLDAFLLSDHLNVGFSYDLARPPVEFYAQLPSSLDGADLARVWVHGDARWRLKAYVGRTTSVSDSDRIDVRPVFGLMASRESGGLLLRASVIRARLAGNPPELQPLLDALSLFNQLPIPDIAAQASEFRAQLDLAGAFSNYWALGAQYEHTDWSWNAEFTHVTGISVFSAGYASVARRIGSLTVYGLASGVVTARSVVDAPDWATELAPLLGADLAQQAQLISTSSAIALNSNSTKQRALSLGARWDLTSRLALKAQWDYIRTDANGTALWGGSTLDAAHANVASVLLDFIF
jgi:hypothetical protein